MHSDWVTTSEAGSSAHWGIGTWEGPSRSWRLDGRYGQYVVVDDAHDDVLTVTAHEEFRNGRLLEVAHEALLG